jgi:hypothetical protein
MKLATPVQKCRISWQLRPMDVKEVGNHEAKM